MKKVFSRLLCACAIVFLVQYSAQAQVITTIAGIAASGYNGDGIPATSAKLSYPTSLAIDRFNNIYLTDYLNYRVRKITPDGTIHTIAGTGVSGYSGDGGPATAARLVPLSLALDTTGNVFVVDYGSNRIRKITPAGIISTVAGNGTSGSSGNGGPATDAQLADLSGVTVDPAGNIYISSSSANTVRKVTAGTGIISLFAGALGPAPGDGGPATAAHFMAIAALLADRWGNIYITDNGAHRIRKVNTAGIVNTIAGTTSFGGYSGDGGPATSAVFSPLQSCALDSLGNLYIADGVNHVIRIVDTAGIVTTYAGNGTGSGTITGSYSGDGGPATAAGLNFPIGTAIDGDRNLYIADYYNQRIRKVTVLPSASIVASKDTICADSCITFINTGFGTIDSVTWVVPGHTVTNPHSDTIKVCYSALGSDTVSLHVYNISGSDTAIHYVYVRDCSTGLGIVSAAAQSPLIFPNPAGNSITVAHAKAGTRIHIYNAQGQLALDIQAKSDREIIDTHILPEGVYCIRITGADYQTVKVITIAR